MPSRSAIFVAACCCLLFVTSSLRSFATAAEVEFRDGDRVVLLGSGFLERAQRYGYFETEMTRRWPRRSIQFRNLAWSGDTVFGDSWVYSLSHPNHEVRRDQVFSVVEQQQPTVVLLGFGAIEAFEGPAGLDRFRAGLQRMLTRLEQSEARLMLLTAPPQEPRGRVAVQVYNQNLAEYMSIVREAAAARGLPLIDLHQQVREFQQNHPEAELTEDGLHYTQEGYRVLARLLGRAMGWETPQWSVRVRNGQGSGDATSATLGEVTREGERLTFTVTDDKVPAPYSADAESWLRPQRQVAIAGLSEGRYTLYADGVELLTASNTELAAGVPIVAGPAFHRAEALRQTIVEKNRLFFARWRPENEVYLRGFRRREQGRNTIELPLFDPLVQKQEQAIARLRYPETDYYHLIPAAPASSRGPAILPDTDPAAELASFELPAEFEMSLFASEPMIANPICINWDAEGKLWVATSRIYPHLKPGEKADDKIVVLEDLDGDGRADRRTVFADGLLVPTSVIPGDGGVYVANSTELVHLSDTDGDGRADRTRVVLSGFGTEDTHQILHAFHWGPGGRLYFNQSVLIHSHVETPYGVRRLPAGGVWEFDPDNGQLEIYTRGMVNPWGNRFDKWGQSFATDGAYGEGINYIWPGSAFYWAVGVPRILKGLNPGQPKECGLEILSGRHMPETWRGRFVTADFRAHRVVSFELSENRSSYFSEQKEDLIRSDHVAFRPVDLKMGPDGALYVCDWYNPIINHGEVDFRDPRRDHRHGRIWRVTARDRAPLDPPKLAAASPAALTKSLAAEEQWTRDTARREMRARDRDAMVEALDRWLAQLDRERDGYEHQRLEALWAFETIDVVRPNLVKQLLHSGDHRVRAAAVRVLSHQRDAIPDANVLLEEAVIDDHPRVRLEAVNALRDVGTVPAFEAALRALDHPLDEQIDFALWVTVRELEEVWLPAFEAGQLAFAGDPERVAFVLAASEQKALLEPLIGRFPQLQGAMRDQVAALVAAAGAASDLRMLLDASLDPQNREARARWLGYLLDAVRDRGVTPDGDLSAIRELLPDEPAAISLAGEWRVEDAAGQLVQLSRDQDVAPPVRLRAITALALIGGDRSRAVLQKIGGGDSAPEVRTAAVAALATLDIAGAASLASDLLTELPAASEAGIVFDAFLRQPQGPPALADNLRGKRLPVEVANVGLSKSALFGSRAEPLIEVLNAANESTVSRADLSPDDWSQLLQAVASEGDPAAGESIFRRDSLGCVKCHAVGGAGGKVGPDLMSLGASAPLDYVAESLVHPSRKIKEGYETSLVILEDGQVLTGMQIGEIGDHLLLRDPDNIVRRISSDSIDEKVTQPISLMPPGITDVLTRQEFVDLVRFLTEIGKSEEFRVPAIESVRVWQTLQQSRELSLSELRGEAKASWQPVLSEVRGTLPLAELATVMVGGKEWKVARFAVDVHRPGRVGWLVDAPGATKLLLADRRLDVENGRVELDLSEGSHEVIVLVEAGADRAGRLRITRDDPSGSPARSVFQLGQ